MLILFIMGIHELVFFAIAPSFFVGVLSAVAVLKGPGWLSRWKQKKKIDLENEGEFATLDN